MTPQNWGTKKLKNLARFNRISRQQQNRKNPIRDEHCYAMFDIHLLRTQRQDRNEGNENDNVALSSVLVDSNVATLENNGENNEILESVVVDKIVYDWINDVIDANDDHKNVDCCEENISDGQHNNNYLPDIYEGFDDYINKHHNDEFITDNDWKKDSEVSNSSPNKDKTILQPTIEELQEYERNIFEKENEDDMENENEAFYTYYEEDHEADNEHENEDSESFFEEFGQNERTGENEFTDNSDLETDNGHGNEENLFQGNNIDEDADIHWTPRLVPGNRIVNAEYLINVCMAKQKEHSQTCEQGVLQAKEEKRSGFDSKFTIRCNACPFSSLVVSQNPNMRSTLNTAGVWSALVRGNTYQSLAESAAVMDIPPIGKRLYYNIESKLHDKWEQCCLQSMEKAGNEEREEALRRNHVDDDGIPWVTVYVDGGWSTRSYGHRYTALSGAAVIVGQFSKKVLFVGIRNKFCILCVKAKGKNETAPAHRCFKNWDGSSPAMEADILVEGFNKSIEMHGLKYKQFIADGDSNSYSKIQQEVTYGHQVTKVFCRNHLMKNFGKALYELQKDMAISAEARKMLTKAKIADMEHLATKIVYPNANGDVELLKRHLEAVSRHPFGDHLKCDNAFCNKVNTVESGELIRKMEQTGLQMYLYETVQRYVIAQAHKLLANETNNQAELFFAHLCKYNSGKRLNLMTRGSFETRVFISVLRYNEGPGWQTKSWKDVTGCKPGVYFTKHMEDLNRALALRHDNEGLRGRKRKRRDESDTQQPQQNAYGRHADQGRLTAAEFESERQRLLRKINVTADQIIDIEAQTRGQWNNPLFVQHRKLRLSASVFGRVIHRRSTTDPINIIKDIIYIKEIKAPSVQFGKRHEAVAIRMFEEQKHTSISPCGLFIDERLNFLSATPDGLVGRNGIIEVKCCYTAAKLKLSLHEAVRQKKVDFLQEIEESGQKIIKLKKQHSYFFQVQGQLHIAKKDLCFFIVFVSQDQPLFIQPILKQPDFFENKMERPLTDFYFNNLLPALIERDARMQRNV